MGEKTIDQEKLNKFMNDGWSWRDYSGGQEDNTFILVDEAGVEYPAVLTDEIVELTATENDLRLGKTALNDDGVLTGEKEIPSYYVTEGWKLIPVGSSFSVSLPNGKHSYTKLQGIFCPFNTSLSSSVAADRVAIENKVYPVKSSIAESDITTDDFTLSIVFGIVNNSSTPYLIRYFTYKEVY